LFGRIPKGVWGRKTQPNGGVCVHKYFMINFIKNNWLLILQVIIIIVGFPLILFFIEKEYMTVGPPVFFFLFILCVLLGKNEECKKLEKQNKYLWKLMSEIKMDNNLKK